MGSESDCLFGQFDRILWISDSETGVKTEKPGGVAGEEGECGDDDCSEVAGERKAEFGYFACEKKKQSCPQVKCQENWWVAVRRNCGVGVCLLFARDGCVVQWLSDCNF